VENAAIEEYTVWVTCINGGKLFKETSTNQMLVEVSLGGYSFDVKALGDIV